MDSETLRQVDDQAGGFNVRLRNETLQLIELFSNEYSAKALADMLYGSWIALKTPNNNPEYIPQVAHSVREFIEKSEKITGTPVEIEGKGLKVAVIELNDKWSKAKRNTKLVDTSVWSGTVDAPMQKILKALSDFFATFSATHRPRSAQHRAVLAKLDGSGQPIPETIAKERLAQWSELDTFFKDVAHHKFEVTEDVLQAKMELLEDLILDIRYPERTIPIEILRNLDSIIAEGNAV